jgi:transposase-like protein
MATKRTAEEIQRLLEGYRHRSVTRAEYCREHGISTSTLDYHLHRETLKSQPRLARVRLAPSPAAAADIFAVVLRNGRRIESRWGFRDADLARLIRLVEAQ